MERREVVQRAWNRVRVALLWARKRRKLVMELRVLPKYLKCLGHNNKTPLPSQAHYYFERELSFDKTPIFNVKMYRPSSNRFHIPCFMNPQVDFDDHNEYYDDDDSAGPKSSNNLNDDDDEEEEEEIDERAEEFIAKFYQQLKMQRQISYLQYSES